jgi:hypothetical protein
MAVIVEKNSQDGARLKSISFPPSAQERDLALELDLLLQVRIPAIEEELIQEGLLPLEIPNEEAPSRGGSVALWWNLGRLFQPIVEDTRLVKPKERRFLWEAMRMYATQRIQRVDRGPSRVHWEYCYRVSKFPWTLVCRLNWDDWVFFLDSKSLRQEQRVDDWVRSRVEQLAKLSRQEFRKLTREINRKFRNKDTSVFDDTDLFRIYDQVLENALSESSKQKKFQKKKKD